MAFRSGSGGMQRTGRGFGSRPRVAEQPASGCEARTRAVGMLARRDLPSSALKGRLTDVGFAAGTAEAAVTELEDERLVNDERFVEAAVASRVARGHGPIRITMELRRLGVAAELITAAVDARSPDWLTRAQALRRRRFGAGKPDGRSEQNRQTRFLLYRGFTGDQARAALGRAGTDLDEDLDVEFDSAALEE